MQQRQRSPRGRPHRVRADCCTQLWDTSVQTLYPRRPPSPKQPTAVSEPNPENTHTQTIARFVRISNPILALLAQSFAPSG